MTTAEWWDCTPACYDLRRRAANFDREQDRRAAGFGGYVAGCTARGSKVTLSQWLGDAPLSGTKPLTPDEQDLRRMQQEAGVRQMREAARKAGRWFPGLPRPEEPSGGAGAPEADAGPETQKDGGSAQE